MIDLEDVELVFEYFKAGKFALVKYNLEQIIKIEKEALK